MTIDTKIFLTQNISMLALQNLYRHYRIRPATQNRSCITESKMASQNLCLRYRIDNCCTESNCVTESNKALQNPVSTRCHHTNMFWIEDRTLNLKCLSMG